MTSVQAPATSVTVTRRSDAALLRAPVASSLSVPIARPTEPQPGERGHLQHMLVSAIRTRHYSRRTEQAYWHWTRQFVLWSGKRHPLEMGAPEVGQFLSHLSTERTVSASTQRQALAALLFLYREALQVELPWIDDIVRAKQPQHLPVVLTRQEVALLWQQIPAASRRGLVLRLLYGTGMRLMEGLRLRMQDVDFRAGSITVRAGKGNKDRTVMLPKTLAQSLRTVMDERTALHQADLIAGRADACGHAGLRFHDLRHSAASSMINAGVPLYTVGAVLVHKAPASTKRYSHLDTSTLAEAVGRIGRKRSVG